MCNYILNEKLYITERLIIDQVCSIINNMLMLGCFGLFIKPEIEIMFPV